MTLRRYAPLALAALAIACTKVDQEDPKGQLVFATFDSVNSVIPTPNDLALQAIQKPSFPAGAQKELLQAFVTAGGFPWDQEVSVSVPFRSMTFDPATDLYVVDAVGPAIDATTATASTVAVIPLGGTVHTPVAFTAEVDAAKPGLLKIRKAADATTGSRRWAPGRYAVAIRGGANGVKTATGRAVSADQAISLVIPNRDMTVPANQPPGGLDPVTAATLDGLRKLLWNPVPWCNMPAIPPPYDAQLAPGWNPVVDPALAALCAGSAPNAMPTLSAFDAISAVFPADETAAIVTFEVAPQDGTVVLVDAGSGVAPLPNDLMRDPITGLVAYNPAFGPAAAGLATLDGFSTTAMALASTSGPIDAATVTAASVKLFKLGGATPELVYDLAGALGAGNPALANYVTQPPDINQACPIPSGFCTTAIGLQPAVPAAVPTVGTFYLPPLEEGTSYAVVITDGVEDVTGAPLVRPTVAKLLLELTGPFVTGTTSLLAGIDSATAKSLEDMRAALAPIFTGGTPLVDKATVTMAYTFRTQAITPISLELSWAPYSVETMAGPAFFTPTSGAEIDPLTTFGLPASAFPNVAAFVAGETNTLFALDLATGALKLDTTTWSQEEIPVLVAVPQSGLTAPCTPVPSPLVVVHHGINGSRTTLLPVADALTAQGFVVAAIDAPYHGARAYCAEDADCGVGGTCTPVVAGASLAAVPGTCTAGTLQSGASGNYFISSNFFRTRDAIRQDLLDQSGLILSLARPPSPWPQPAANPIASALADRCIAVDPTQVYYLGVSLGGSIGANVAATNPRVSRAVLNVAGGTLVDVFTNAPAFAAEVDALFLEMGIDRALIPTNPAVAAAYLKTLNVAKWILDPADPINFAAGVATKLDSPIAVALSALAYDTTDALGQASFGDTVIPNPYNSLLYSLAGIPSATYVNTTAGSDGVVPHGVIGDTFATTPIGGQVRTDAAAFLLDGTTLPADDDGATPGTQVNLP